MKKILLIAIMALGLASCSTDDKEVIYPLINKNGTITHKVNIDIKNDSYNVDDKGWVKRTYDEYGYVFRFDDYFFYVYPENSELHLQFFSPTKILKGKVLNPNCSSFVDLTGTTVFKDYYIDITSTDPNGLDLNSQYDILITTE